MTTNKKQPIKPATGKTSDEQVSQPACNPKQPPVTAAKNTERNKMLAKISMMPSTNAATVAVAFQSDFLNSEGNRLELMNELRDKCKKVHDGDVSELESMLVSQSVALESMFTHLARRAAGQEQLKHYQSFMMLALKAQAQSRATITALVDLKYPKQAATFVKQANISSGHQQVNNGAVPAVGTQPHASAGDFQTTQNKLLENNDEQRLDFGAQATTSATHQGVETVGTVHRG